jgi:hypothetical protein
MKKLLTLLILLPISFNVFTAESNTGTLTQQHRDRHKPPASSSEQSKTGQRSSRASSPSESSIPLQAAPSEQQTLSQLQGGNSSPTRVQQVKEAIWNQAGEEFVRQVCADFIKKLGYDGKGAQFMVNAAATVAAKLLHTDQNSVDVMDVTLDTISACCSQGAISALAFATDRAVDVAKGKGWSLPKCLQQGTVGTVYSALVATVGKTAEWAIRTGVDRVGVSAKNRYKTERAKPGSRHEMTFEQ